MIDSPGTDRAESVVRGSGRHSQTPQSRDRATKQASRDFTPPTLPLSFPSALPRPLPPTPPPAPPVLRAFCPPPPPAVHPTKKRYAATLPSLGGRDNELSDLSKRSI